MSIGAKIAGWWATAKLVFVIGFSAGFLCLVFVGVPFFMPSYLDLRVELAGYTGLEDEATELVDKAEGLRAEENRTSVDAVNAERDSKDTVVAGLVAENERLLRMIEQGSTHDESICPSRGIIDARELFLPFGDPAESLRPTGDR